MRFIAQRNPEIQRDLLAAPAAPGKEILTEQEKSFDPDIRSGFFFEFTNERFGSGLFECNMTAWERVVVILRFLKKDLSVVDQNA